MKSGKKEATRRHMVKQVAMAVLPEAHCTMLLNRLLLVRGNQALASPGTLIRAKAGDD